MKYLLIVAPLLFGVAAFAQQRAQLPTVLVSVKNPIPERRPGETIALRVGEIAKLIPSPVPERLVVIDRQTGISLLTQVAGEEILFQCDIAPGETRKFRLLQAPGPVNRGISLVDGRFVLPREDFAWENDRIAYRMYGPALAKEVNNGIDVWTKRVRSLIVEKWYRGEEPTGSAKLSYHVDRGEGADFFSVGTSLGAGGSGIWQKGTLYQPGVFTSYRIVANGPIRVVFDLFTDSLRVEGMTYRETRRISLDAGGNLNRVDLLYTGGKAGDLLHFAAGLAKRKDAVLIRDESAGWMSLWGPVNADSSNGALGTGIVIPPPSCEGGAEDAVNHLMIGKARTGERSTYFAGAGWSGSGDFPTAESWRRTLANVAARLRNPLAITLTLQQ